MDKKTKILILGPATLTVAILAALMSRDDIVIVTTPEEDIPLLGLDPFIIEPTDCFEDCLVSLKVSAGAGCGSRAGRLFFPEFMNRLRPDVKPGCG